MDLYSYAADSPSNQRDPSGMCLAQAAEAGLVAMWLQGSINLLSHESLSHGMAGAGVFAAAGGCLPAAVGAVLKRILGEAAEASAGGIESLATEGTVARSTPSSRALGANLEAAGIERPAESAAHHIVAGNASQAAEAREILARAGIDINSASNGVFLPRNLSVANPSGAAVHSIIHTNVYYNAVNVALRIARPGMVADTLLDIAEQLLSNTFPF